MKALGTGGLDARGKMRGLRWRSVGGTAGEQKPGEKGGVESKKRGNGQ